MVKLFNERSERLSPPKRDQPPNRILSRIADALIIVHVHTRVL